MQLLNKLAGQAAGGREEFKGSFVINALRELSVGLCRGNAVIYSRGLQALASASGTLYQSGMDEASADVP